MIGVPDNCGFGFWKCRGGGNKWVFKRQVEQEFSPFFGEKNNFLVITANPISGTPTRASSLEIMQ